MNGYININQKGLVDFCTNNNCKIDLIDSTILSYIANFLNSSKIIKKLIDNRVYGWISTKKIIDDNPLLNINNTEVIGRRVKKLTDIGLLYVYLSKEEGNKKYYAISDDLHKIITNSYDMLPADESIPTDSKVDTPTDSKVDTLPTFESGNSKINSNLNNSNKKINKKSYLEKLKSELFNSFKQNKLLSLKEKINISKVDKDLKDNLYSFKDINIQDLVKAYTNYVKEHRNYAKRLNLFIIALVVDKNEEFTKYLPKQIKIDNLISLNLIDKNTITKLKLKGLTTKEIQEYITLYNKIKAKEYLSDELNSYYKELDNRARGEYVKQSA